MCQRLVVGAVFSVLAMSGSAVGKRFSVLYDRRTDIHPNTSIYWSVDAERHMLRVAVHAKLATGWAGIGISEMGGMEGADIVYFEGASGNLTDAHALTPGKPVTDVQQDWTLVWAKVEECAGLQFEAERPLDTGDVQDRALPNDTLDGVNPTRIIAAWGDNEEISYHVDNVATMAVLLYAATDEEANIDPLASVKSEDYPFFDTLIDNFEIPATKTHYEFTCRNASDMPATGEYHGIGFQPILDENTEAYVHHLVVKGYVNSEDCHGDCSHAFFGDLDKAVDTEACMEVFNYVDMYAWAPGVNTLATPDDVGFPFGASDTGFKSLGVSIHYNNVDLDEGVTDNSGVRVYYTTEPRPIEAGFLQLGDPFIAFKDRLLPDGKSLYSFSCPSSCTEQFFQDEEVTVFGHVLHMHATGQRMVTQQYRDGEEIFKSEVEYYAYDHGGGFNTAANSLEKIQKGDRFETSCYYDTDYAEFPDEPVTFGFGSENEMCIDFIYYYPAQSIPYGLCGIDFCGGSLDYSYDLEDDDTMGRTFGIV